MKYKHRTDQPTDGILYGFGVDDTNYPKEKRIWNKDGTSELLWIDPIYCHWKLMLRRVFKDVDKGYENTYIQESWLKFSNYKQWFENNKPNTSADIKLVVEKDLLSGGNSRYSEQTCLILPHTINAIITSSVSKKADFPVGVYYDKSRDNYQGYYTPPNSKRKIKRFDTVREAHKFWQQGKIEIFYNVLQDSGLSIFDPRLKIGISELLSNLTRALLQDKVTLSLKGYNVRDYLDSEK